MIYIYIYLLLEKKVRDCEIKNITFLLFYVVAEISCHTNWYDFLKKIKHLKDDISRNFAFFHAALFHSTTAYSEAHQMFIFGLTIP